MTALPVGLDSQFYFPFYLVSSYNIQRKQLLSWEQILTSISLFIPDIGPRSLGVPLRLPTVIITLSHLPLSSKNIFICWSIRHFSLQSTTLLAAAFCLVNINIGWASAQV